ncbi:MAG: hypothetical protein GXP54_04680, partial [Deltaproteobacteria bacterium]|nr:hypothetical protein [Deltaproteobacteria bacterium]
KMNIRRLEPDDPALDAADTMLTKAHGRGLGVWGAGPEGRTLVFGGFHGDDLAAVGILQDYRDPALHVGSQLDLDRIRDILEMKEVGLYQIALLHAHEPLATPQGAAEALIPAFEDFMKGRYERYCLFITLMKRANKLALPLYRRLGFKKSGQPSSLMSFDLKKLGRVIRRIQSLPNDLEPRFFDEATEKELKGFADCYGRVFLDDDATDNGEVAAALERVTSMPDFSARVSLLLLDRHDKSVVGFMLADRPEPGRIHIGVAGLLPRVRGRRLPYRCLPPIAERAFELGIERATFVTTQGRVARLTLRAFGAREVDQLGSYYKIG